MAMGNNTFKNIINDIDKSLSENISSYTETKKIIKNAVSTGNSDTKHTNNMYCSSCGKILERNATFCGSCGAKVKKDNNTLKQENKIKEESPRVYKCPNCGASIESFNAKCNYCNAEIKNGKVVSSLEEFTKGLNIYSYFDSIFVTKKASYIINYPVPNSKEDLLEFMILATSNIKGFAGINSVIQKAWISKAEQIYEKSKITLKNTKDFDTIEKLYNENKRELKNKKVDLSFYIIGGIFCYSSIMFLLINYMFMFSSFFILLGILLLYYYYAKGEGNELLFTSIKLKKSVIISVVLVLFVIGLVFGGFGIKNVNNLNNTNDSNYTDTIIEKDKDDNK